MRAISVVGRGVRRWSINALVVPGAVLVVVAVLSLPSLNAGGLPMDEGMLLALPLEVLDGRMPDRDFQHLYGPGVLWLLASIYKILGASLLVERLVGLAFHLLLALGIYLLALPRGRLVAGACALTTGVVLLAAPVGAFAWVGGTGLAATGLALTLRAAAAESIIRRRAYSIAGGLLIGLAFCFRYDLAIPALLGLAPLLGRSRSLWRPLSLALLIGVSPYLPYLALIGYSGVHRLAVDVVRASAERRLPLPTVSSDEGQLLVLMAGVLLLLLGASLRRERAAGDPHLLAAPLFLAGLLPYALSRADRAHLVFVGSAVVGFMPAAFDSIIALAFRWQAPLRLALAALATVLLSWSVAPDIMREAALRHLVDLRPGPNSTRSFVVRRDGREFRVADRQAAENARRVLAVVETRMRPGTSMFVGQRDLRLAAYNDAFLYFLLPEYEPASYYMILNPGTANRSGSALPRELARADFLILNRQYDSWDEPNGSSRPESTESAAVVARAFCRLAARGSYELLVRCRAQRSGP